MTRQILFSIHLCTGCVPSPLLHVKAPPLSLKRKSAVGWESCGHWLLCDGKGRAELVIRNQIKSIIYIAEPSTLPSGNSIHKCAFLITV